MDLEFFGGVGIDAGQTVAKAPSPSGMELAGLGILLAASVVVPLFVGIYIDSAVHTTPLGLVVGLVLGIVTSCSGLYVRLKRYW